MLNARGYALLVLLIAAIVAAGFGIKTHLDNIEKQAAQEQHDQDQKYCEYDNTCGVTITISISPAN